MPKYENYLFYFSLISTRLGTGKYAVFHVMYIKSIIVVDILSILIPVVDISLKGKLDTDCLQNQNM